MAGEKLFGYLRVKIYINSIKYLYSYLQTKPNIINNENLVVTVQLLVWNK